MQAILVNTADWAAEASVPGRPGLDRPEVPEGWLIANAPRPLAGRITWTGPFRHGTFYAASPELPEGTFGWEADDGWLVEWIDNEVIRARVLARVAGYGYDTLEALEEDGIPVAHMAADMQLPWHEEAGT